MSGHHRLRSLYVCYLSLEDPLVHSQVVAYLRGLAAAGHEIHLVTFETRRLSRASRRRLGEALRAEGIYWHGLRYHKRPSLPATAYDTLAGALYAAALVLRHQLDTLHVRSHVPAAMALITQKLIPWPQLSLIFDIRGLMAEEYEDANRWTRQGIPFRLTKAVESAAIARADGIVVLTERVARQLFPASPPPGVRVIPCCADVDMLVNGADGRARTRHELRLMDATVMIYVGKFGGWYMAREMAEFFATARISIPNLHFLILSQDGHEHIRRELERESDPRGYTIASAPPESIGRYLAAADFGIAFIRPSPSKVSSCPTKIGEYLAASLPVLCTADVGDINTLVTEDVGVLVRQHAPVSYQTATAQLKRLLADPETPARCLDVARQNLSLAHVGIPRYQGLYQYVADLRGDGTPSPERRPVAKRT